MVELSYNGSQTVKSGGVVVFNNAVAINNNSVMHREGNGVVTIMGGGCRCSNKGVVATFSANIAFPATAPTGETAATAPVSLAFAIGGEPSAVSDMVVTPAAADEFYNVSKSILVDIPGNCCTQLAVENTSNGTITVENPVLIIDG